MKRGRLKRGKPLRPKPDGRDWIKMGTEAHRNSGGKCEWCGEPLPLGTSPAHIIPRDKNHPELDEAWNLAMMGFIPPCTCHTKFDRNRAKAVEQMEQESAPLVKRIWANHRLRDYFLRKLDRRHYLQVTDEMWHD